MSRVAAPQFGNVAGPIAVVTFLPDARSDNFDLLQSTEPGAPTIAKEPQRGVVDFYKTPADVPQQLPNSAARGSTEPTFIVDVSRGGFARLEKAAGAAPGALPSIEASPGVVVQQFVPSQPFSPANDGNSNLAAPQKKSWWPWWATALLITLAVLAIIASLVAIVLAVQAVNKEKAEAERLEADETRLARAEASIF